MEFPRNWILPLGQRAAPSALMLGRMTMTRPRTIKALGVALAAVGLMAVAGCGANENANQVAPPAAESQDGTATSEAPKDIDYRTLVDGITYKGQPVIVRTPDQIEEFIQVSRDAEAENAVDNVQVEPAECAETVIDPARAHHADRMTVDNFTMADLDIDSFTLIAQDTSIADYRMTDMEKSDGSCDEYTVTMHGYTQHITDKENPFEGDANKGRAIISHSVFDDGIEATIYNVAAEKNGAYVNVVIKDDSQESIDAANATLDQVLARL